ncbi:Putative ABC transport system permease protein [Melioribacter roseus P3M-2]|jgi:phospholipid/cholesterol/gamma-HCH transport system permease protein|uniref:Putative ABC transport system permease protein n=1 Tax=Melioribacter roseus (strain DSM 23840 / JCM 17771 / VKM B-2668 / P3M-2) TaxID=1191523 RepID=I6Z3P7_MELRP|nr:ABC transporter permease [Melioribacter roseus]AFN73770.1 Putative ABC transport system permease protein [Melioribacter roseus P3M-2]
MKLPKHRYGRKLNFSDKVYNFFATITGLTVFNLEFFKQAFLPPYEIPEVKKHMDELGVKTFGIVSVTGFIIGLVLAMQSQPVMARFGASDFLPGMVALSVVRELGPVITALIFAGRVSSGIGAELGSMRVTEQIDAMEVTGVNPFKYLVVTRVIATTMILPILTVYVIVIAIFGGYLAILITESINFRYYIDSVVRSIEFGDFVPGVAKTFVFGYIVGIVGAYKGYTTEGGTEGVGRASTTAVVLASLLILIFDMILVKITLWLWPTLG